MKTGERIKKRRIELNISVEELANRVGKDRSTIYRYESGDIGKLSIDMLKPIAEALETSIAYILGVDDSGQFASTQIDTGAVQAAYASTNKAHVKRLKKWVENFGHIDFTEEEHEQLISFAEYLIYKRG